MEEKTSNTLKDKVHKRLRLRVVIYFIISVIVLGISIFHIIEDYASVSLCVVGLLLGVLIGLGVARMYKISWDNTAEQVISKFDFFGIVILFLYIGFEIFRERIVEQFVHGPSVVAVSFAVLAGIMYGRVMGISGKINKIFKEEGVS
jgi:Kef-type K+ transport system membrane component KefB